MIDVEVRLYATLRRYAPGVRLGKAMRLSVERGSTLQQIYDRLGVPVYEVKRAIVNGVARDHGYSLSDGDRVAVFPPVAGG